MSFKLKIRNLRRRALAGAALLVATFAGSMTDAQATEMVAVEHVRIGQFNLNTEAGSRAAFDVLASASRRVCRVGESRILSDEARAQACFGESLANAVQAAKSERLTQLYREKAKAG